MKIAKHSSHLDDERMERYALGTLAAPEIPALEQHLLLCGDCQDRLAEMDAFVQGMRAAARQVRAEEVLRRGTGRQAGGAGAA